MKKIPTLFKREFENHAVCRTLNEVLPGLEWVLEGDGEATVKFDGACCAIINGHFFRRYDAKKGKTPPDGAIPCCDPDPVTGHWPHWVEVTHTKPEDKWFVKAYEKGIQSQLNKCRDFPFEPIDGTYEAVGPHFQSNPYHLDEDEILKHGDVKIYGLERSYEAIRDYLKQNAIEGIVFWKDGTPQCKIKRSDFGFKWPVTQEEIDNEGTD